MDARTLVFAALLAAASASKNSYTRNLDLGSQLPIQLPGNIPILNVPLPEEAPAGEVAHAAASGGRELSAAASSSGAESAPPVETVTSSGSLDDKAGASALPVPDPQSNAIESSPTGGPYQPNWASIDSRPLPSWYDDAKIGIFIHWGVYSVPSISSEWFWIDWKGESTHWKNGKIPVSGRRGTAKAAYKKHDLSFEEEAKKPLKPNPAAPSKRPNPMALRKDAKRQNTSIPLSRSVVFGRKRDSDHPRKPDWDPPKFNFGYGGRWFDPSRVGYRRKRELVSIKHPGKHLRVSSIAKRSLVARKHETEPPAMSGYFDSIHNFGQAQKAKPKVKEKVKMNKTRERLGKPSPNPRAQRKIEQFMKANYKPGFSYQDFAKDFTAEFFDPSHWADIIEGSGAKYVVFTSKHHEGYALWPSKYSYSWNSMDVGPHRDLVGDLRKAIIKKKGIKFGLYHSLYEWFHPLYLSDKSNNFTTKEFVNHKIFLEMKELVNLYKPEVFWSDGEWEAPSDYWRSTEFLAWLYNRSPVKDKVVVNDRWGQDTLCKHGGMFTCQDRYNPGKLQQHKWENAMTIDKKSWGFNRMSNLGDYMTTQELIDELASTVSCGGNIVMNVGPSKDGTINPIFQDRLSGVGKWLKINGEAIYGSRPWDNCQNDTVTPNVWYTVNKSGTTLYAVMLRWPSSGVLDLGCPELSSSSQAFLLEAPNIPLKAERRENVLHITLPDKAHAQTNWGSVIKITKFNKA